MFKRFFFNAILSKSKINIKQLSTIIEERNINELIYHLCDVKNYTKWNENLDSIKIDNNQVVYSYSGNREENILLLEIERKYYCSKQRDIFIISGI